MHAQHESKTAQPVIVIAGLSVSTRAERLQRRSRCVQAVQLGGSSCDHPSPERASRSPNTLLNEETGVRS